MTLSQKPQPDRPGLEELRRLAEQATPGPWRSFTEFPTNGGTGVSGGVYQGSQMDMGLTVCQTPDPLSRDAAYIAAANPSVILALLSERQENQRRIVELRKVLETVLPWVAPPNGGMTYRAYEQARSLLESLRNE